MRRAKANIGEGFAVFRSRLLVQGSRFIISGIIITTIIPVFREAIIKKET